MESRREQALIVTLDAMSKIQRDVSLMLGAKAEEAEKVRNWILNHIGEGVFQNQIDLLGTSLQIHEQMVEVIDGLTKICNGLSRNMRTILHPEQDEANNMPAYPGGYGPEDSLR